MRHTAKIGSIQSASPLKAISPRVASQLANSVYDIQKPTRDGYKLKLPSEINKHFSFDLSNGPIKGKSGGSLFIKKTTGFAVIGQGIGMYAGHHAIVIRGTDSGYDWLTDGNCGLSSSASGKMVHQGFEATFRTMRGPFQDYLSNNHSESGTIHCIGHSLGGALATLTADWIKSTYSRPVNLYTFGAPRVGLQGFSSSATTKIDNIYRCTHGADPVPKVPLWPFVHTPYNGKEFRLDAGEGISFSAHSMKGNSPGYLTSAASNDWSSLSVKANHFLDSPVRLKYENSHQASFTSSWADKIGAALITLLKDAGYYSAILAQAAVSSALTFYDLVAQSLEKIAKASKVLAEQTKGLLGHMLAFARQVVSVVGDLTYQFIKFVFDKTLFALYSQVRQAIGSTF